MHAMVFIGQTLALVNSQLLLVGSQRRLGGF